MLHGGPGYRAAGVSVYTHQLLLHLPRVSPENRYIAFHGSDAPPLSGVHSVVSPVPVRQPLIRIPWEQIGLPVQACASRLDLVHGTVNVVPVAVRAPSIVTIHDLSFLRYPDRFPRARVAYLRHAMASSARRATHLIAVSEHTRQDLVELLHVPAHRISVVYSGVADRFRPLPEEEVVAFCTQVCNGRPYILHVGTLEPRKNIDLLIRAFARVRAELDLPHLLALVGARGWMYHDLFRLVRDHALEEHVRFFDYVDPASLPLWYNGADLFAYPSAYEGFGLPVLEAMACGVPVITSASSALKELASHACLTVEPSSEEALHVAIARLLTDESLRRTMRVAGLERAATFSWERTARDTARVYEQAREEVSAR